MIKDNNTEKEIWIFLSHSLEDYDKVRQVRNILEEHKLRPLMFFLKCLTDDDEIDGLIKREIDCRTRFILCDSENSRSSAWVKREVEYIESKDKPYEVVDLSKPVHELEEQLLSYSKKSSIYISYPRSCFGVARQLSHDLDKFDFFQTELDADFLSAGENFEKQIIKKIEATAESCGNFIVFLDDGSCDTRFQRFQHKEIGIILHMMEHSSCRVFPVYMSQKADDCFSKIFPENGIRAYDHTSDVSENIFNSLLSLMLTPGEMRTYYENFKTGRTGIKDEELASRLEKLLFSSGGKL